MEEKPKQVYPGEAAKTFYYIALGAFSISLLFNQPVYFQNNRYELIILDTITVVVVFLSLILYTRKIIDFRFTSAVFIYGTVLNLSVSIWLYYYQELFFAHNFLFNTIIFSIYLVLAGFCIGRKHVFFVAAIFVVSYVPLIFISGEIFLLNNAVVIPFLIVVYSFAVSTLIHLLERSNKKEIELRKAILEKDKALVEEQNKWLNCQLESRKREIVAKSIFLAEQVENNIDFTNDLITLKSRLNKSDQVLLHNIIEDHRAGHSGKHWQDFETSFLEVNPEFYNKLHQYCHILSPTQRKLAALIHLGLSSKQIGSILSISTESVEVARSRLRTSLNLPADTNLKSFLNSL